MKTLQGKTYAKYTRCSTEEQAKGYSHDYQHYGLDNSRIAKEMQLLGTYSDTVTGTRFDNRESLDLCFSIFEKQRGALNYLFVYRWDRLGREVGEAFFLLKKFKNIGVEINCPDCWIDFKSPDWPLSVSIQFGMAHVESLKTSERTRDGIYEANRNGCFTGTPPVGYKRIITDEIKRNGNPVKVLVPDDEKAYYIKEVFQKYSFGACTKAELYQEYKDKLGIKRNTFFVMFHNIIYTGKIYLKPFKENPAQIIDGKHDPIIDPALFSLVQKVATENRHGDGVKNFTFSKEEYQNDYYLKGLLRCDHTGNNMTAYQRKKKSGNVYHYYQTINPGGKIQIVPVFKAHQIVYKSIGDLRLNERELRAIEKDLLLELGKRQEKDTKERIGLEKAIATNLERVGKLEDSFADGNIDSTDFKKMTFKYKLEITNQQGRLELIKKGVNQEKEMYINLLQTLENIGDLYVMANNQFKKQMLKAIFPEGFSVASEIGKVRTNEINEFILQLIDNHSGCENIINKNGLPFTDNPVLGGSLCQVRTAKHFNLLYLLFKEAS